MPIVRADVPVWATEDQLAAIKAELRASIEHTWARDHIWVAVRPMHAERSDTTVILTVDLRDGRGQEKRRTQALFDEALAACHRIFGTTDDKLIVLVRKFKREECVSGGSELPPLEELTPPLRQAEGRKELA